MGKWPVLFIAVGLAAIGLGFTKYIQNNTTLYFWGGGGALIVLVIIYLIWKSKRNKKLAMQQTSGFRPAPGGAREMPALNTKRIERINAKIARERERIRNAEAMEMRAINPKKLRTGTA